jgi:hypothetical protein
MSAGDADAPSTVAVHSLPFKTDFRGTTGIQENFKPTPASDGGLVVHFRGRRLVGTPIAVPRTHIGVVALVPKMLAGAKRGREPSAAAASSALDVDFFAEAETPGAGIVSPQAPSRSSTAPASAADRTPLTVLDRFDEFVVWEHDRAATGAERAPLAFLAVAAVLHAPEPTDREAPQANASVPV